MSAVTFTVTGIAQPKGSAKAHVPKAWADQAYQANRPPRAIVTHDNAKSKGWQQLVAEQAQAAARHDYFAGPVALTVTFALPRPKTLPKHVTHHVTLPDVDKLVRCVGDALTGVLFDDDKQIVQLHARKVYAPIGAAPSATITLEDAAPPVPVAPTLFDADRKESHGEEGSGEEVRLREARQGSDGARGPRPAAQRGAARHGGPRDSAARGGRGGVRRDPR